MSIERMGEDRSVLTHRTEQNDLLARRRHRFYRFPRFAPRLPVPRTLTVLSALSRTLPVKLRKEIVLAGFFFALLAARTYFVRALETRFRVERLDGFFRFVIGQYPPQ
jgi:hypothetical protein